MPTITIHHQPGPPAARPGEPNAGTYRPFESYAEYHSTPGIAMAMNFAEACNMLSLRRLDEMLASGVQYTSKWTGFRTRSRAVVLLWFKRRFLSRVNGRRYHAQIVILPDGEAGVLVEILPDRNSALITFTGNEGLASSITVNPDYDSKSLRLTGYFPPEA